MSKAEYFHIMKPLQKVYGITSSTSYSKGLICQVRREYPKLFQYDWLNLSFEYMGHYWPDGTKITAYFQILSYLHIRAPFTNMD